MKFFHSPRQGFSGEVCLTGPSMEGPESELVEVEIASSFCGGGYPVGELEVRVMNLGEVRHWFVLDHASALRAKEGAL
jgi:hypothetical protein